MRVNRELSDILIEHRDMVRVCTIKYANGKNDNGFFRRMRI